jgi:hypothetical protein
MVEMKFNEEDKQKIIEFLNMTAKHSRLDLDTAEIIQYFKLLNHMQAKILPKVEANIFEIKRVIEPEAAPSVVPETKAKGKK